MSTIEKPSRNQLRINSLSWSFCSSISQVPILREMEDGCVGCGVTGLFDCAAPVDWDGGDGDVHC